MKMIHQFEKKRRHEKNWRKNENFNIIFEVNHYDEKIPEF